MPRTPRSIQLAPAGPATRTRRADADKPSLAEEIGARIRRARLAAGLTQTQLAAGRYTKAYISALETGQSRPSMVALDYLAERLGLPRTRFLEEQPEDWTRLEADLELAAGRWQRAIDAYGALLEGEGDRRRRAELQLGLAEAWAGLDRGREAATLAAEASRTFASLGREAQAALADYWLSCGEYQQGNTREASAILEAILARVRAGLRVEPDFQARVLMALSNNASQDGEYPIALAYLEEIRHLSEELDDRRRGIFYFGLAQSYRETGDYEAAIRAGLAGLTLLRQAGLEYEWAGLQNGVARTYLALGNTAKAAEAVREARATFEKLGDRRWLAYVNEADAKVHLANGDHEAARTLAEAALQLSEQTSDDTATLAALTTLARVRREQGSIEDALGLFERAAELATRVAKAPRVREVLSEFAEALEAHGDHDRAFTVMRDALRADRAWPA